MKKYLVIQNHGILEPAALTLVGASTKADDDSKIGMFGSGNKYALAYLLRNGYDLHIMAGKEEMKIETSERSLRGNVFNVIRINGEETSITTSMGKDWTLWQSIREFFSNAVDEGLKAFTVVPEDEVMNYIDDYTTTIFIRMNSELEEFILNIDDYFAMNKVVFHENEFGRILKKHGSKACVYRRGIRCYETSQESLFDYDLNDIAIDENRLVKFSWRMYEKIWSMIYKCDNPAIIRQLINNISTDKYFEANDSGLYSTSFAEMNSGAWSTAIEGKKVAPKNLAGYLKDEDRPKTIIVPSRLYNDIVSLKGNDIQPYSFTVSESGNPYTEIDEINPLHQQTMKEVFDFLKECKLDIPYPIRIVKFGDSFVYGGVEGKTILVGINSLEKGKHETLNTIIEEYMHIKSGASDCTREFQTALIDEFINYIKLINAYNL